MVKYYNNDIIGKIYESNKISQKISNAELYDLINKLRYIWHHGDNYEVLAPIVIETLMDNQEEVLHLIENGVNLNDVSSCGYTPLVAAICMHNYYMAKLLLENGANPNINDDFIPLHVATSLEDYDITKLLIDNGAFVNKVSSDDCNALHRLLGYHIVPRFDMNGKMVCKKASNTDDIVKIIDLLVNKGIDVNHSMKVVSHHGDEMEVTPLALAVEKANPKIVKKLIESDVKRSVVELDPSSVYEYQDDFNFLGDLLDGDISCWKDASKEYIHYLKYKNIVKKYDIEVTTNTPEDGYKRPKMIKRKTN